MNDPHVVAVVFQVEHRSSVSYSDDAPPITREETAFRVKLENGTARFDLKEHFATEEEALERVGPYARAWEMDACLRGRPGDFNLRFQRAEIVDRDPPPPGTVKLRGQPITVSGEVTTQARLTVVSPAYPSPPSGLTLNADDPDVATMFQRLDGYYSGREPLPGMAYFCLTVLEHSASTRSKRKAAAAHYHINVAVLDKVANLSSTRGGAEAARKADATGTTLSRKEEQFLEAAVKEIIRRAAEVAQDQSAAYPTITLADLPDCT